MKVKYIIPNTKKLSQDYEWQLKHIIKQDIDTKIYKKTFLVNSYSFNWNANPIFVFKFSQI